MMLRSLPLLSLLLLIQSATTCRAAPPPIITHVGLSVPDMEAAVEWYTHTLGFRFLPPIVKNDNETCSGFGDMPRDLFGPRFGKGSVAMLTGGNGVALELFTWEAPKMDAKAESVHEMFWKPGYFHLCLLDPDIRGLAKKVVEAGGKQMSQIWPLSPDGAELVYMEDPWGNAFEILTHSSELAWTAAVARGSGKESQEGAG